MSWRDIGGSMQGIPWQALRELYSTESKPGNEPKGILPRTQTDKTDKTDKDLSDGEGCIRKAG